jgi:hypothetical protein
MAFSASGCAGRLVLGFVAWGVSGFAEPEGLLEHFLARMRAELERLPDYACGQTVERFSRTSAELAWEKSDTLRFEVALIGNRELYARPGDRQFQNRQLIELVGRGTISTGQFANLAKHVFLADLRTFRYSGEVEEDGRRAHEYKYDIPAESSSYRLRSGMQEATVAFQGSFWLDAATADLIRLDVQAYDMPEALGLAEASTSVKYERTTVGDQEILLPVTATLTMVAVDGLENLNRTRLTGCRRYQSESAIRYAGATEGGEANRARVVSENVATLTPLPAGALLELALDSPLNPGTVTLGDSVKATVSRPLKDGEKVLVPQGAVVSGHVVRLDRQTIPFPTYEIGLEFNAIQIDGRDVALVATMVDAGPASGLIRQSKRLDPTFTRRRSPRLDVLVREVQRGQGILTWDARRGPIGRGLRMMWRVNGNEGVR